MLASFGRSRGMVRVEVDLLILRKIYANADASVVQTAHLTTSRYKYAYLFYV